MSAPRLVIRPAERGDIEAVRALLVETWHATYDGIYGRERVRQLTDDWHSLHNLTSQIDRPNAAFLVALAGEELVATSSARVAGLGKVSIGRLYVRPSWQGRGVGRRLLDATIARFAGAKLAELEVEAQNEAAIAFYERCGFSLQRMARFDGREDTPNTLVMAKVVAATASAN